MGTQLKNKRGKNLYEFWGTEITDLVNADLRKSGSDKVINLASNEYFSSVKKKELKGELITPVFKDEKNGKYKVISFFAKKARGMMADYVVRNGVTDPAELKKFRAGGIGLVRKDRMRGRCCFCGRSSDLPAAWKVGRSGEGDV